MSERIFEEYGSIKKEDMDENLWKNVKSLFEKYSKELENHVEERPSIFNDRIEVKSVVGKFLVDDVVFCIKPKKLRELEINVMLGEIGHFLEALPIWMQFEIFLKFFRPLLSTRTVGRLLEISVLLGRITRYIISRFLPLTTQDFRFVSPTILGRIDVVRTIKTFPRGLCFVSKRRKIVLNYPPLVLLAFFNNRIANDLAVFGENMDEYSREELKQRIGRHFALLSQYPLSHVLRFQNEYNFWNRTLLSRILNTTFDLVWKNLVKLWLAYIEELEIHRRMPRSLEEIYKSQMLIPMSKLYEFYLFCQVVKIVSKIAREPAQKIKEEKFSITIRIGKINVKYNCTENFEAFSGIIREKYRPDIVIECGDADNRRAIIIDAKYRELGCIKSEDMHRLLSYVKDFELKGYTNVHGMFAVLEMNEGIKDKFREHGQFSIIEFRPSREHDIFHSHLEELLTA